MLQQTQTERVLPKYAEFLARWPTPADLAAAPVSALLGAWSGLGYNRRALALKKASEAIAAGGFPDTEPGLRELPGIGPYTARALLCFAYGAPVTVFETNVRAVFLHAFFREESGVPDKRLAPLVEAALDRDRPREWNWALMDLGVAIKKRHGNPNRKSADYVRQSPFKDSRRRVRGAVLRLLGEGPAGLDALHARLPFSLERVEEATTGLLREGFLAERGGEYRLRD